MDPREALFARRASAPLEVYLLGRFEVVRRGPFPPQAWRRRRPADLLKLVALSPAGAVERDAAIELLWPGKDLASGANNLHRALYDLRQVLGGRFVDVNRGVIALERSVWVDAVAFEAALETGEEAVLEPALALYRGELSPEDHESSWLASRREALRLRFATAALPLARTLVARGEASKAIPLLRRLLEAEPTSEEAAVALVRLLAESGRRREALRVYEACELGLRAVARAPGAALRELRDAIQQGAVGPPQILAPYDGARRAAQRLLGAPETAPLRGRTAALLLVESLLDRGAGTIVLLGEAGVGTTRLALEGARLAQQAGALVLAGSASGAPTVPFAPFADAFADWSRGGGPSDPIAGATPEDLARGRLVDAIRGALATPVGGRPVVLVVDDLHEADEPSASLFHQLAREAWALRLVLVATCREDRVRSGTPVQALLAHLDCERLARGVRVQRLDLAATGALVEDVLGEPPPESLVMQVYRASDGLPHDVEELARAWAELRRLPQSADAGAAVRERAARLGPRAGALLASAAAAGARFDLELLRGPARLSRHDALAALDACLAARLLVEDGPRHRFRHPLVRERLYAALPPTRRAELHAALAHAIADHAAVAPEGLAEATEALAAQLRDAGDPATALPHLVAAGRRAEARAALAQAQGWYGEALAAAVAAGGGANAGASGRVEILEAQGRVELALGDLAAALRALEAAADLAEEIGLAGDVRARLRRWSAIALLVGGHVEEGRARLEAAIAEQPDESERGEAQALLDAADWALGRSEEPPGLGMAHELGVEVVLALWERELAGDRTLDELAARAAAFVTRPLDPGPAALGRAVEGVLSLRAGRWDVAERALREAAGRARDAGAGLVEAFALGELGTLFTVRERAEEGLAAIGDGLLAAGRAPLRRHALVRLYAALANNRLAAGAIYAADDAMREASASAARHGGCALCDVVLLAQAVRVALARGRPAEAEQEAARLAGIAARRGGRALLAIAREARALVLAAQGGEEGDAARTAEARRGQLGSEEGA